MMGQKSLVRNMASLQKFLHILFRLIFLSREMDSTPPSENRAKSCAEPLLNSDSVRHSLDSSLMDLHSRSKLVVGGELRVHRCIPLLGIHRRSKRWFSVDSGLEKLCWRKKNSRGKFKTINSSCIVDLIQGTKLFRSKISSQAEEIIQDRTFSIVLEYGQLDLEAESQRDREEWIFALKWLQNWNRDRIGRPFNFRHLSHVNSEYKWKGGTLEDSFELLDLMGKGAYGKVYRAKHKSNGFQIAVKVIEPIKEDMWFLDAEISKARQSHHSISMPENLIDVEEHHPVGNHTESHISSLFKEFINEVDILKQCRHQNIVNFYGCGVDQNNRLWILMDLCEFGSLRSLLSAKVHRKVNLLHRLTPHYSGTTTVSLTSKSSSGKNSADQSIAAFNTNSDSLPAFQETIHGRLKRKKLEDLIAFAMFSIIQALIYLHENHILHRDIKAGNILISKNGVIQLSDFGVSKQMQTENEPGQDSMEHAFVGSLLWMAPEILRHGGSASTEKSDIWSLGITAIELAEHEPPHSEVVNASELRHRILYTEMVGLSNQFIWSEEFQDFVNCCLKKDPILRPSAIELSRHPFIRKGESSRNLLSELLELLSR